MMILIWVYLSCDHQLVCCYKARQLFYYKVRKVLLQNAAGIAKCVNFITKCEDYCKVQ